MKVLTNLLLLLALSTRAVAQENYDASLIPKELLPYASAVVRNNEISIEVKDLDNTYYRIKTAVTVLNKNGDDEADVVVFHDKANLIKNIKGVVYNQFGKPIGKFSESDFQDDGAVSQSSLFEDTKVKHYQPAVTDYPYTVVYEYEFKSKQTLSFADWEPKPSPDVSVEKSSYTFSCKPDFKIRYKELNILTPVVKGTNKQGEDTYTWQVSNIKASKYEPYSPVYEKMNARVKVSPQAGFNYLGVSGSFNDWNGMGKWIYDKLLSSRKALPQSTISKMQEITAGIADPKEKAKKIYEYMQGKTHYISVQVGIGGYQPFLASDVDQQNYGDCKALVNYTQSLLKAVDIDSYYCIVKSGSLKSSPLTDFASMNQFDHVILCLPFKSDTTFLECTSQQIPFGFLGDFTDDRDVLACTPNGGRLIHTPKYTAQNNLQQCKASFTLDATGQLTGDMTTTFRGTQYDNREGIIHEAPKEQVKSLQREYPINNLDIEKFGYKQDKKIQPVTTETIKLTAPDYGSVTNGKIDFIANAINRVGSVPKEVRNRHTDLYINRGYTDEDEITYKLPKGYHVDIRPAPLNIEKPFGKFSAQITVVGDELVYKRKIQVNEGTYNKDLYQEFVDFYQAATESDNSNVTLVKDN